MVGFSRAVHGRMLSSFSMMFFLKYMYILYCIYIIQYIYIHTIYIYIYIYTIYNIYIYIYEIHMSPSNFNLFWEIAGLRFVELIGIWSL